MTTRGKDEPNSKEIEAEKSEQMAIEGKDSEHGIIHVPIANKNDGAIPFWQAVMIPVSY